MFINDLVLKKQQNIIQESSGLGDVYRDVAELNDLGLTLPEIAQRLGMSTQEAEEILAGIQGSANDSDISEAISRAQQAAIAIAKKKKQGVAEGFDAQTVSSDYVLHYVADQNDRDDPYEGDVPERINQFAGFKRMAFPIKKLKLHGYQFSPDLAKEYSTMSANTSPPIVVEPNGEIIDGYHRAQAAVMRKDQTIDAFVGINKENVNRQGMAEGSDDIAQAKERLSYLEKIFDTSYEYSDDHSEGKSE